MSFRQSDVTLAVTKSEGEDEGQNRQERQERQKTGRFSGRRRKSPARALPGFKLSFGITVGWLTVIVLIPLSSLVFKTLTLSWDEAMAAMFAPRVMASYRLSFGMALVAALINLVFGTLVAWSLVRYRFFGKQWVDALIDLPFALPTAVAGIALTGLYAPNGWLGAPLASLGIKVAYTPLGILIAMIFIGLPFVVRTLQPVLEELEYEQEEAAASLGANGAQVFWHVIRPALTPALLTGFALSFARATGEYGSIIFIAGNMPFISEITPLMIVSHLEEFDYAGATAIAIVMLTFSFLALLAVNLLQGWSRRKSGGRLA